MESNRQAVAGPSRHEMGSVHLVEERGRLRSVGLP
jgi:hypothetical protein